MAIHCLHAQMRQTQRSTEDGLAGAEAATAKRTPSLRLSCPTTTHSENMMVAFVMSLDTCCGYSKDYTSELPKLSPLPYLTN